MSTDTQAQTTAGAGAPPPATPNSQSNDSGNATPPADKGGANAAPPKADTKTTMAGNAEPKGQSATPPEIEIKLPEGFKADTEAMTSWKKAIQDMNLEPEAAKKLAQQGADIYVKAAQDLLGKQTEEDDAQQAKWQAEVKADKEFGGTNFEATAADVQRAVQRFGGDAFRQAMNESRMGDHPEVVRFIARVGKAMREDSVAGTGDHGAGPAKKPGKSEAEAWFPNSPNLHPPKQT